MAESDDGTKPVVTFRLGVGSDKAPAMVMMGMAQKAIPRFRIFSGIHVQPDDGHVCRLSH
jgi:hypothetical protein